MLFAKCYYFTNYKYMNINKLVKFRHKLHQNAELSDKEVKTNKLIKDFIYKYNPNKVIENIGGYGLAAIYDGKMPGDTVIYRADIDALPIFEDNLFDHKSIHKGVSHKCGHDGHTAVIASLAIHFSKNPIKYGKAVLLFQPSEETGKGAIRVIEELKQLNIIPKWAFAFHNLPGFPLGSVVVKSKEFTSASKGLIFKMRGESSHASNPNLEVSPSIPFYEIIKDWSNIDFNEISELDSAMLTLIHARLGEVAFGTTPHYAEIMATLRSSSNETLDKLANFCIDNAKKHCKSYKIETSFEFTEVFEALYNHPIATNIVYDAAKDLEFDIIELQKPFSWSEDFSHIANSCKGAMFGFGVGENHVDLHHKDYDFPDAIIPNVSKVLLNIAKKIHY